MTLTDVARDKTALLMAYGSGVSFPRFLAVGSGSGAAAVSNTALIGETGTRADFTTRDVSTAKQIEWVYDISSVSMSGLDLTEFGVFDTSTAVSGTMWEREGFSSIEFDGTNELQVQINFEIF